MNNIVKYLMESEKERDVFIPGSMEPGEINNDAGTFSYPKSLRILKYQTQNNMTGEIKKHNVIVDVMRRTGSMRSLLSNNEGPTHELTTQYGGTGLVSQTTGRVLNGQPKNRFRSTGHGADEEIGKYTAELVHSHLQKFGGIVFTQSVGDIRPHVDIGTRLEPDYTRNVAKGRYRAAWARKWGQHYGWEVGHFMPKTAEELDNYYPETQIRLADR